MTTAEQVRALVNDQLDVDCKEGDRFMEDLGADSLDSVELILTMEEAFDVEISDEQADAILTVQDAITFICDALTTQRR